MKNQPCPFCSKKTLSLIEDKKDIPYFGKCFLMTMSCSNCKYHKFDIESAERKDPVKYTFVVKDKDDMKVRVVKSAEATIKVPTLRMDVRSAIGATAYISNIEGVLRRFKKIIEGQRDSADDPSVRKKAKNLLKKLRKIEDGELECKIVIEDKSGNSAIISDKAEVSNIK